MLDNWIIYVILIPAISYMSLEESNRPLEGFEQFEFIVNNYSHLATIEVGPFIQISILVIKIGATAASTGTSVDP